MDFKSNNEATQTRLAGSTEASRQEQLAVQNTQAVVDKLHQTTQALIGFLQKHNPEVTVKNPTATMVNVKMPDIEAAVAELNKIKTADASSMSKSLDKLNSLVDTLVTKERNVNLTNTGPDYTPLFQELRDALSSLKLSPVFDPKIMVKPSDVRVTTDLTPVINGLDKLATSFSKLKFPEIPKQDNSDIVDSVASLKEAVNALNMPVPHVGPSFKNSNNEEVRASVILSSGVNAIPVVNPDGSTISGGGGGSGTQYTDAAVAPAHPVGTIPVFNNGGTITAVTALAGLPVAQAGSWSIASTPEKASAAILTNVATSTASTTLLASNGSRKKAVVVNDSTALLYVKYGTTASATSFSYILQPNDSLDEVTFTGRIDGILASGTGTARITEM